MAAPLDPERARSVARQRLPHFLFEYFDGAAFDGVTAEANVTALRAIELRQRVLRDVADVETECDLLGERVALPLVLGPVGLAGLAAARGEVQAARAAAACGVPMALSTTSIAGLDEVAAVRPPWFQLYMVRDRGFVSDMLDWAEALGCTILVLTVDVPVLAPRWRDTRSGLTQAGWGGRLRRGGQMAARPGWLASVGLCGGPHNLANIARFLGDRRASLQGCMAFTNTMLEARLGLHAIDWIRARWRGRLIVKGMLEADDALGAVDAGADALVVSNHGGRQLDGVAASAVALPRIADVLGGRVPLLVDGGVRSGLDVLRCLALGASAVMLGRAWVMALACGGQTGVKALIHRIEAELRIAMALTGCQRVADVGRHMIRHLDA